MTYLTSVAGGVADGGSTTLDSPSLTVSGSNKVMWVLVGCSDSSPAAPSGVVWDPAGGAQACALQGSGITFASFGNASLWRLIAPADATGVVRVTWGAAKGERICVVWVETGIDQTTPNGTVQSNSANTFDVTPVSAAALTTTVGQRVLQFAHSIRVSVFSGPPFTTPSGTERQDVVTTGTAFDAIAAQEQTASGSSTTPQWASIGDSEDGWATFSFALNDAGSGATADQEGARFGNDDGSESAHTFAAAQDANLTAPLAQNVIVRAIVDTTGDLASTAFTLRYQKNGAGGYVPVPVGATVPEVFGTVTYAGKGTGANGGTTVAPAHGSPSAGWYMLAVITSGATNSETPTAPDGSWAQLATGASTDGTYGVDTGPRRVTVFGKEAAGTEGTGTETFSITNGGTCRGDFYYFSKSGSGAWQVTAQGGNDSTSGTGFSVTTGSINWNTGDGTLVAVGQRVDTGTQSSQSLTASGVTFGTRTNRSSTAVTTGNDHRHVVDTFDAVTGTSNVNAAPTWAYTASTSVSGGCVVVRLREYTAAVTNELYVAASSNIAAGGEATTARLTAPSGKSTSDFVTGRRWDDENGSDSVDITTDDYTELEWCLQAQSPAANGDYFDFRVYAGGSALGSYSVTPRWTLGTPASPSDVPLAVLKQPNAAARLAALRRF